MLPGRSRFTQSGSSLGHNPLKTSAYSEGWAFCSSKPTLLNTNTNFNFNININININIKTNINISTNNIININISSQRYSTVPAAPLL